MPEPTRDDKSFRRFVVACENAGSEEIPSYGGKMHVPASHLAAAPIAW
jgi:hypothetical protein